MTRSEIRIYAEETYRLMKKDMQVMIRKAVAEETEVYFNTMEAAEFLGVSASFIKAHIKEIPHTKVGRLNKFKRSSLVAYRSRN